MSLLNVTEIKKCPFFPQCGDPTAKEGCRGVGGRSGRRKQWCDGNARWERWAGAICKWDGALLNSWQSHRNGIAKEGGRTHHPQLLYHLCGRKRTCMLHAFSLDLKETATLRCHNNFWNILFLKNLGFGCMLLFSVRNVSYWSFMFCLRNRRWTVWNLYKHESGMVKEISNGS